MCSPSTYSPLSAKFRTHMQYWQVKGLGHPAYDIFMLNIKWLPNGPLFSACTNLMMILAHIYLNMNLIYVWPWMIQWRWNLSSPLPFSRGFLWSIYFMCPFCLCLGDIANDTQLTFGVFYDSVDLSKPLRPDQFSHVSFRPMVLSWWKK